MAKKSGMKDDPRTANNGGNGCISCIVGFFASKQLANKNSEIKYLSSSLCELFIYILFLVTLSVAAFGLRSFNGYYFNNLMVDLFVDAPFKELNSEGSMMSFRTSSDINDFWGFAESVMIDGLYNDDWRESDERRVFTIEARTLNFENVHLGRPRLRQVRIQPSTCPVEGVLRRLSRAKCYLSYEKTTEDNRSLIFLEDIENSWIEQKTLEDKEGIYYWGKHNSYSGGGAYILLGTTEEETKQLVNQLKIWQWITRATRAIFLDFIVYNPNINLFAVVKLVWEFHPAGGVTTSWIIHTVGLERYKTHFDIIIFGFEIAFCVFTLYYFLQEITEMCNLGIKKYFRDIWSWMDLFILTVSSACIGFSVYRYLIVQVAFENVLRDPDSFSYFETLGFWESQFNNALAICVFLSWLKIFKYISFNKTMGQISNTMARCYTQLTGFFMMFILIFFGFVLLGYFLFHTELRDFRNVLSTIFTLLRLTLGDFDFADFQSANRVLGPIYFFAYTIFIIFILMNMFLAIINDTYEEVLMEIVEEKTRFRLSHCLRSSCHNICSALCCRKNKPKKNLSLKKNTEGSISYAEIKDNLVKAHFTELEVESFLARHELDEDHNWDEDDIQQILSYLENESYDDSTSASQKRYPQFDEGIEEDYPIDAKMSHEDVLELNNRIESLEDIIARVESAVDRISSRIQNATSS